MTRRSHSSRLAYLAPTALALCLGAGPAHDRSERINALLEHEVTVGDVDSFQVALNGQWVVYRTSQPGHDGELYAVPSDRSAAPIRITPPGVEVGDFEARGTRVVYRSGDELFKVGVDLVPVLLYSPQEEGESLYSFERSGSRVLYKVIHEDQEPIPLYSVPIDGGTAVRLTPHPAAYVVGLVVAPDGVQVVAHGNLIGNDRFELFRVPIDGSAAPVPLCGPFSSEGYVRYNFDPDGPAQISPDGSRVVYRADQNIHERVELFSVPLDASSLPVRLNQPTIAQGDVETYRISPDGQLVVYRVDQTVDGVHEIFVVPIEGGVPPTRLSPAGIPVNDFEVSPDGNWVAFATCGPTSRQVFSVPIDGSAAPVQLSALPNVCAISLSILPDSSRVLYRAPTQPGTRHELFAAPIDGSSPAVTLNHPLPLSGDVESYRISADAGRVVYHGAGVGDTLELFSVPPDGSSPAAALNATLRIGTRMEPDYALAGDGVFFRGDVAQREAIEVHAAPLDAGAQPLVLNHPLPTTIQPTDVMSFALSPDGNWAVYTTTAEVIAVPLASKQDVRTLYPADGAGLGSATLCIAPDSTRVAFRAHVQSAGWQIFTAPIDGSSPAVQISRGMFAAGFGNVAPRFSPDSAWVVYGVGTYYGSGGSRIAPADGSAEPTLLPGGSPTFTAGDAQMLYLIGGPTPYWFEPTRLQVRPTDGSSAPLELAPYPLGAQATVTRFRLCPDETRVVYHCDQELQSFELFSVPIDGSAIPTKISGTLDVDRDVSFGFHLTPDGTRAVYAADRDVNETYELYVTPVDGTGAPLELSGPMVVNGDVALDTAFSSLGAPLVQITADSSRLVYVADQELDERFELYGVPLDGSQLPLKLSALPVANGDVSRDVNGIRISPDGTRVVYLADQEVDEVYELYSTPIDGSAPVVNLTGALNGGRDVLPGFVILESAAAVLFFADLGVDDQLELWLAPLDGSRPATRRCELAHPAGDVQPDFALAPDERDVFYRADETEDELVELFRFPIRRVPHHVKR